MVSTQEYAITNGYTERTLVTELKHHFALKKDQSASQQLVFFDTFDWRLFNASLFLYRIDDTLVLGNLKTNNILHQQKIKSQPQFIWDFPEGRLKSYLDPIIQMRALIKLAEVSVNSTTYRVLNDNDKTVVRVIYENLEPKGSADTSVPSKYLFLKPVKGYDKEAASLKQQLNQMGLVPQENNLFLNALALTGKTPGDYSAKLDFGLEPHMRADEAAKVILRFLLAVMKRNEEGIKQDIDTEFLHDFRVAVRRTRSALSQIKGVFPAETTLRYKQDFSYIGKFSNNLRDLDVYLLAEDSYKAMLTDPLQQDIDPLFDYLRQKRTSALKRVTRDLNSKKYIHILQDWEAFLNTPTTNLETAPKAKVPIIELAQDRIYKKYRRIIKRGRKILVNTEDEQLHALRIECKKLRYLMEFFESLFPPKKIAKLIKQVKKLQNNLGDFNDLCVQEEYLLRIANEIPLPDSEKRWVLLATGALIGTLNQERVQVKAEFANTFARFVTSANRKLFKKLFATRKRVALR